MLTPNSGNRVVLLPQDREIMAITGMSESEYRKFVKHCLLHSRVRPGEPTAFLIIPFLIQLVIGIALSLLASALMPKAKKPPTVNTQQKDGQNIVDGAQFAPKTGFDSVQNVVELGSVVPLVYAKRETIDGITYGGVRINTNLLWSQIYSLGGSQMLRAVFLVGEGSVPKLDPLQFAVGNNLLGSYDLSTTNNEVSRVSIYYSPDGGRLLPADYIAGRDPASDVGNAVTAGAPDVFSLRGVNNTWTSDFCYVSRPSNQTTFGVYAHIGNYFGYRTNPRFTPRFSVRINSDEHVECPVNAQESASREKQNQTWSSRSGLYQLNGTDTLAKDYELVVGDWVTYRLRKGSDAAVTFRGNNPNGPDGEETCKDIAQTVAGRQRSWDDNISVGELYRLGSALAICTSRSPDDSVFISEIDNEPIGGGTPIDARFQVIRAGRCSFTTLDKMAGRGGNNATKTAQIFKCAIASFVLDRPSQVVEVGIRSAIGAQVSGLSNFRDGRSYDQIDGDACLNYLDDKNKNINTLNFTAGSYSGPETRYSFFKVGYRVAGTDADFTLMAPCFGVRSQTQQATYNYLRFEFPNQQRWEFEITPITGWELRQGIATGGLEVLDPHVSAVRTVESKGVVIRYTGEPVSRSASTFYMSCLKPQGGKDLGNGLDDGTDYADAWARVAEAFIYNEITTSASSQPEHEVVYINTISPNPAAPEYDDLAIVGMNIRSSTEFSTLEQFSVYVNEGLNSTHLFPEILRDLLTNPRYGTGEILSEHQIDDASFAEAAAWTQERRYFFDGGITARLNLRSWGAERARDFLLDFVVRNGKFAMQPAAEFDGPEKITGLFTSGNILEDSFSMSYADQQDRQPPRVSVKWREEKQASDPANRGLFPVIREVTVREASAPEDAPLEQIDLSDFCTSEIHAIDRAKWECRFRRLVTHSVSFKTTPDQAVLDLGRVFKLGMETITYGQPYNGAIAANGSVTTWPELPDGDYAVLLYDGVVNAIQEVTLSITDGRCGQFPGSVFCLKDSVSDTQTYKVQSLGFDEDGNVDVEALLFPTDARGYSLLTTGWNVDGNWVIDGALGNVDSPVAVTPQLEGVTIIGPATATAGSSLDYAAVVDGPDGLYSYLWSDGTTASTTTVLFGAVDQPLTVTVSLNGNVVTTTRIILVFAPAPVLPVVP